MAFDSPYNDADAGVDAQAPGTRRHVRLWYPIRTLVVDRVRVEMFGAHFIVTGWRERRGTALHYFTMVDGDRVELKGRTRPNSWRPIAGEPWRFALPPDAVAHREMVVERLAPKCSPDAEAWPGAGIERDLLEAWRIDRMIPDRERGWLREKVLWPPTSAAPGDWPSGISLGRNASSAEVSLWERTMALVAQAALSRTENHIVRLRARGYTWPTISLEAGMSQTKVQKVYREAVAKVREVVVRTKRAA